MEISLSSSLLPPPAPSSLPVLISSLLGSSGVAKGSSRVDGGGVDGDFLGLPGGLHPHLLGLHSWWLLWSSSIFWGSQPPLIFRGSQPPLIFRGSQPPLIFRGSQPPFGFRGSRPPEARRSHFASRLRSRRTPSASCAAGSSLPAAPSSAASLHP